ncbi:MAG: type II toxin-antitoxin system Phd/YefM family antitoxin [Limisphaerales bacterium]
MEATLTEMRREPARLMRAADDGDEVLITEHGQPRYKLTRVRQPDRKKLIELWRGAGEIPIPPRQ